MLKCYFIISFLINLYKCIYLPSETEFYNLSENELYNILYQGTLNGNLRNSEINDLLFHFKNNFKSINIDINNFELLTYNNYTQKYVTINNNNNTNEHFLFTCFMSGDQINTVNSCLYFIINLIYDYKNTLIIKDLFNYFNFIIIPIYNIEAFMYYQNNYINNKTFKYIIKNNNQTNSYNCNNNEYGINLLYNFNYNFKVDSNICDLNYSGEIFESESETINFINIINNYNISSIINIIKNNNTNTYSKFISNNKNGYIGNYISNNLNKKYFELFIKNNLIENYNNLKHLIYNIIENIEIQLKDYTINSCSNNNICNNYYYKYYLYFKFQIKNISNIKQNNLNLTLNIPYNKFNLININNIDHNNLTIKKDYFNNKIIIVFNINTINNLDLNIYLNFDNASFNINDILKLGLSSNIDNGILIKLNNYNKELKQVIINYIKDNNFITKNNIIKLGSQRLLSWIMLFVYFAFTILYFIIIFILKFTNKMGKNKVKHKRKIIKENKHKKINLKNNKLENNNDFKNIENNGDIRKDMLILSKIV